MFPGLWYNCPVEPDDVGSIMIKDKFPDDLKDILKKYQNEWYKDDPHKDLYTDWIQKYPSEAAYTPKHLDVP